MPFDPHPTKTGFASHSSPALKAFLVAFDQTNQDPATLAAAAEIAIRIGGSDLIAYAAYAYKGEREPRREEYLNAQAAALSQTAAIPVHRIPDENVPIDPHSDPYEQILGWTVDKSVDLVVVPAPYLDDFWKLGRDSAGATLDVLMARSRKPLLVIRKPPGKGDPALPADVLLPIVPHSPALGKAAAWAIHLVRPGAHLDILAVLPPTNPPADLIPLIGRNLNPSELSERNRDALAEFAGSDVHDLLTGLVERASPKNVTCKLVVRSGEFVRSALSVITGIEYPKVRPVSASVHRAIAVLGCSGDTGSESHQCCAALVRNLSGPALIATRA